MRCGPPAGGLWGRTCVARTSRAGQISDAPTTPAAVKHMFDHYGREVRTLRPPPPPAAVERMF